MKKYEVMIVGGGPAGLTSALYCARAGLKTAIISKDIGGTANYILKLENWPGFKGSGPELIKKMYEQVQKYEVDFIIEEVNSIEKKKEFLVKGKKEYFSKAVIIASGTRRRKLNLPREEEFIGKGISYCVTCDAFFFKNKIVGVIGGSDCAGISALALSDVAKKVYVFYRGEKLRCENINSKRLEDKKNVEIKYNSIPTKIKGDKKVEGLEIKEKGKKKEFELDGIFIEVGSIALSKFTDKLKLKLDKDNFIIIDENMKTSVKGIFAAGDITSHKLKQVVVASGQGAIAANSTEEYLKKI